MKGLLLTLWGPLWYFPRDMCVCQFILFYLLNVNFTPSVWMISMYNICTKYIIYAVPGVCTWITSEEITFCCFIKKKKSI